MEPAEAESAALHNEFIPWPILRKSIFRRRIPCKLKHQSLEIFLCEEMFAKAKAGACLERALQVISDLSKNSFNSVSEHEREPAWALRAVLVSPPNLGSVYS